MIFSSTKFRSLPKTSNVKLVCDNTFISTTGSGEAYTYFGLSGEGKTFYFKASDSGLYDPFGRFIAGIDGEEHWKIQAVLDDTTCRYSYNDVTVVSSYPRESFDIERLVVAPTNQIFNSDIRVYTQQVDLGIGVNSTFTSQSSLAGQIQNDSDLDVKVFGYTTEYLSHDYPIFTGTISGVVTGDDVFGFVLDDVSQNLRDEEVRFRLTLKTNIGEISSILETNRVLGYTGENHVLVKSSDDITIAPYFSGESGLNRFIYSGSEHNGYLFWSYYVFDDEGAAIDKTMKVSLSPVTPTGGYEYSTEYITGYNVVDSGRYDICPSLEVSGYYYVSEIDFTANSILFSSGCDGPIPFTLKSVNGFGSGGAGFMYGEYQRYIGIYDSSRYFVATGFGITNGGSGYTEAPEVVLNTGIYFNCYDVPEKFASEVLSFKSFDVTPVLSPLAAYLSGEVICSGVEAAGAPFLYGINPYNPYSSTYDYYVVLGIAITNPGFGYNDTTYKTLHRFVRADGDVEVKDASGNFVFHTGTGLYSFEGSWGIRTGEVNTTGEYMSYISDTGYSGEASLSSDEERFFGLVTFKSFDYTGQVVARLRVETENGDIIDNFITGTNAYSSDPEFLKKNYFDTNYVVTGTDELDMVDYFNGQYTFPDDIIGDDEDL